MSAQNELNFQQGVGVPPPQPQTFCGRALCRETAPHTHHEGLRHLMTPTQHGQAGGEDAKRHLTDEAPGWLLDALGDALLRFQGGDFTSEMVRHRAEESEAVKGWLDGPTRNACFSGWWRNAVRRYRLVRVNRAPAIAKRASRRGATLPWWRWPS